MRYKYEFVKVLPKDMWIQVKYTCLDDDTLPQLYKNYIVEGDFTEEKIHGMAASYVPYATRTWRTILNNPETFEPATPEVEGEFDENTPEVIEREIVRLDTPEFDMFTQYLERTEEYTETQVIQSYIVRDMTPEQVAEFLQMWRASASVSMRQARLALTAQNLMTEVENARAQMTDADRQIFDVEWEYATTVERSSTWVASMGALLQLTDEQLDDLFKLADTL